jgi:hypothetical protein
MGKFGKRRIPKFMDSQKDIQEMQVPNGLEQNHPVQIVSLGDHGDDHVMITIKAENGEELELKFDYNGDGMLTAQNGDHEYTIPVEVEIAEDAETEDDVYEALKGKQKALDKNKNGKIDSEDFKLLKKSKDKKVDESHKAINSFDSFVNECWSPMLEGYNPAMSEEAKRAVKALTEEILIKEAQACSEDADPNHTYESYLNEVGQYMTDCMMESAAGIDVAETE